MDVLDAPAAGGLLRPRVGEHALRHVLTHHQFGPLRLQQARIEAGPAPEVQDAFAPDAPQGRQYAVGFEVLPPRQGEHVLVHLRQAVELTAHVASFVSWSVLLLWHAAAGAGGQVLSLARAGPNAWGAATK